MNTRLSRLLIAMPLLAAAASLTPASAEAPAALQLCANSASPSKLDYLVLASLADSSNWMAMSAEARAQTSGRQVGWIHGEIRQPAFVEYHDDAAGDDDGSADE